MVEDLRKEYELVKEKYNEFMTETAEFSMRFGGRTISFINHSTTGHRS